MELQSYIILLISTVVGNVSGQTCAPNECSEASLPKPMGSGLSGYTPGGSGCYSDTTLVTYICTGSLIGPPTNFCNGGSWALPFGPTCEAATGCSRPQLPANGNVTEYNDEYSLYDRITYYCDDGYSIIGPQEAVCDSGGIWSPSNIPTCEASCTAPSIANGGPNGTFVNGEVMTYSCDVNYTLIGVSSATCRDGLWDPVAVPECLGKCLPPIVANSNYATQQDIFNHASSVIIDCDPGYSTGSSTSTTLTCSDGSSSSEDPTCYENCSPLATFLNGDVTGDTSPFYHTETVTFTCDPSFTLNGASSITCYDGIWDAAQPMCMEQQTGDCPDLEPEAYSAFYGAVSPFQNGDTVTFTCYNGYEIYNGSLTSTCQNGQWSSDPPFCIEQITSTQAASTMTDFTTTEVLSTRMTTLQDITFPSTSQTAPEAASTDVHQTSFMTITQVLTEIQTSFITVSTDTIPPTDMSAVTTTSEIMPSEQTSSVDVTTVTMASAAGSTDSAHTNMSTQPVTTSEGEGSTSAYITLTSQKTATDSNPTTLIGGEVTSPHSTISLGEISTSAQMTVTSEITITDSGPTTSVDSEITSQHSTTSLYLGSTTAQITVTSQKSASDSGSTTLVGGEMTSVHSTTSLDEMSTSQNTATDNGEMTSQHSTTPLDEMSTSARMTITSQKTATDGGSTTLVGGEVTSTPEKNISMSTTGRSPPTASSSKGITEDQMVIVIVTATALGAVTILAIILALISCHHTRKGTSDKNTYETNGGNTNSEHAYDNNGIVLTHL